MNLIQILKKLALYQKKLALFLFDLQKNCFKLLDKFFFSESGIYN